MWSPGSPFLMQKATSSTTSLTLKSIDCALSALGVSFDISEAIRYRSPTLCASAAAPMVLLTVQRVLIQEPLGVLFEVHEQDRTVHVLRVWKVARRGRTR